MRKPTITNIERQRRIKEGLMAVPSSSPDENYATRAFGAVWDWRVRCYLFPNREALERWVRLIKEEEESPSTEDERA